MTIKDTELSRRTLVKGAAWSMPVIAVAAATPMAAASVDNASAAWTASGSSLLSLDLLQGGAPLVGATALATAPTIFSVTNGAGPLPDVTAEFVVRRRQTTLTLPVGKAVLRGYGPSSIPGGTLVSRDVTERELQSGLTGSVWVNDTTTIFSLGTVAAGQTLAFGSIAWGVTNKSGIAISADIGGVSDVTVTLKSAGTTFATLQGSNVTNVLNLELL